MEGIRQNNETMSIKFSTEIISDMKKYREIMKNHITL